MNMDSKRLNNLKVVVTGASRGIGAEIAKHLATEGAIVAITYSSNPEKAQGILNGLSGKGHLCVRLDVTEEASVNAAFSEILEKWGQIDGLVNNAGITKDNLMLRMKTEDFDQVIAANLRGTFLCTKAVLKSMLKSRRGSIVNITSVIGQTGNPGQANYAASKAGTEAFSKSVALELASRNIRSNCVAPGFIQTEMTDKLTEDQKKGILDKVPLQAMGMGVDVAHAVCYLLSDESRYVTGHTINVNGGLYMS